MIRIILERRFYPLAVVRAQIDEAQTQSPCAPMISEKMARAIDATALLHRVTER